MKVKCVSCGYEINLDHKIFNDYSGPIKCYSCSAMMEVKTAQGLICSMANQNNSESRLAGLLVLGPTAETRKSAGMSGWVRRRESNPRIKT
jgi:DNA-directed RNA polymerase subunit N (RpoN/RPB10)